MSDENRILETAGDFFNKGSSLLEQAQSIGSALVSLSNSFGIGGLRFDILSDTSVQRESIITNHYTEDGTPVQDDIILNPTIITLRGEIGEYVDRIEKESRLQKATRTVSTCLSYVPAITKTAGIVSGALKNPTNAFGTLSNTLKTGSNLWETFSSFNLPVDKQSSNYLYFESIITAKRTLTVETPWRKYPYMAIKSVRCQQTTTKDKSFIFLTLQEIRKTKSELLEKRNAGTSLSQKAERQSKGWLDGVKETLNSTKVGRWIIGGN